jgi:hypothetical protein
MSKTLRYRLFKAGAMPEDLRDEVNKEGFLFFEEGIPVTVRRRGTAPGFRGSATGTFSGAFAITDRRVVATVSKTTMVNAPYNANAATDKVAELSIKEDGLHVRVDAGVNPGCTGEIEMHFKAELTADQLAQFPKQEIRFDFPPELVPKIFGVPG